MTADGAEASHPGRTAVAAAGWLVIGGIIIPFSLAFLLGLTGLESSPLEYLTAGLIVVTGACLGGLGFGRRLARINGSRDVRRVGRASAASYGPAVIVAGVVLGFGEPAAFRATQSLGLPIQVLFQMMFVPAVFLVVAVTGLAIGHALRRSPARELALKPGAVAALGFLLSTLIQDLLGRRVGGPGAAATATMVTVAFSGALVAAAAGGAMMHRILHRHLGEGTTAGAIPGM
jgi:hypothetical protein